MCRQTSAVIVSSAPFAVAKSRGKKLENEESKSSWERGSCPKKKTRISSNQALAKDCQTIPPWIWWKDRAKEPQQRCCCAAYERQKNLPSEQGPTNCEKCCRKSDCFAERCFTTFFLPNSIYQLCCPLSINAMRYFTSSIALPLLSSCAITSALLNLLTSVPSTVAFNAEQCTAALPPVVSTA